MLVNIHALFIEIVGADDGGVAAGIATAEPAFFQDCDIGNAMFLGKIICRAETVAAPANDDDIIVLARLG